MLRLGIKTKFEAMEKLESRKSSKSRGLLLLGNTYGVKFKSHCDLPRIVELIYFFDSLLQMVNYFIFTALLSRACSMVNKPLCYHVSNPGPVFDSPWRYAFPVKGMHSTSLFPRAARPTQRFILPRSVNEYRIIRRLTPGHQ